MSMRYKGAVISATPPTLSPNAGGSGAWTLEQQMQANAAGLWPKNGPFNYIEDVFSTYLYTGNGTSQTINNGIDLAGKGGLVWTKCRSTAYGHSLTDTVRGITSALSSNLTAAQYTIPSGSGITSFNSNGFSLGTDYLPINTNGDTFASWTFREQSKFFDVVTYTGDGSGTGRQISHSLGSTPGCIILKSTSTAGTNWIVYHRSLAANFTLKLQTTEAAVSNAWISTVTDTYFTGSGTAMNVSGQTYVAYLFAHNAGGFGLSGNENVISCGSYATDSSFIGPNVNLGFEPQWILVKNASGNGPWSIIDNMRGWTTDGNVTLLNPNSSAAESTTTQFKLNATGFQDNGAFAGDATMIYIAIRRGPMAVPTTGTSVFALNQYASATSLNVPTGINVDLTLGVTATEGGGYRISDRLRGTGRPLFPYNTSAELSQANGFLYDVNNAVIDNYFFTQFGGSRNVTLASFRRAPSFFDEVCYLGSGVAGNQTHNLGVAPELWIIKNRSGTSSWIVGGGVLSSPTNNFLLLNGVTQLSSITNFFTTPTATTFGFGSGAPSDNSINASGQTYVAYLFASAPGVSKVGTFTGTGATQVINCGFTGGARFVLIKATSTTGPWLVWDSARGIVAGDDPYLVLNSTAAEVTNTDWVDTAATGFELSNAAGNGANSAGVSYLFFAVS